MKRIQKFAAVNVIAVLLGTGVPVMAAQDGHYGYYGGSAQHESADHCDYREHNGDRVRDDRRAYGRGDYGRGDQGRAYGDYRGGNYGYGSAPVYRSGRGYDDGYYDHRTHNGRTAAIIGGSAAAGALIGAAAGHGQGAAIGAVVGGIAGVAASAAANHHGR